MTKNPSFPWWLKYANRMVILLNRLGLSLGTMHILSIPGRKTGKMRSTPVSVLRVHGQRYILTGVETGWVKNARAFGWGMIAYGRKKERVTVTNCQLRSAQLSCGSFQGRCHMVFITLSDYWTCQMIQKLLRRQHHVVQFFDLIVQRQKVRSRIRVFEESGHKIFITG